MRRFRSHNPVLLSVWALYSFSYDGKTSTPANMVHSSACQPCQEFRGQAFAIYDDPLEVTHSCCLLIVRENSRETNCQMLVSPMGSDK